MTTRRTITGGGREGRIFTAQLRLAEVDTTAGYTMMQGRACPYGEIGHRWFFNETFAAGLFERSIKEAAASLPLLLFHDQMTFPIGSATEWKSEPDGLYGTWKLDGSADAQRAAQLAADGHLPYMSVGYEPLRSEWEFADIDDWDPDDVATLDLCTRTEARLVETSVVSTPLFASASITLVCTRESTSRPRRASREYPQLESWRTWRSTI